MPLLTKKDLDELCPIPKDNNNNKLKGKDLEEYFISRSKKRTDGAEMTDNKNNNEEICKDDECKDITDENTDNSPLIDNEGVRTILDAIQKILSVTGPALNTEISENVNKPTSDDIIDFANKTKPLNKGVGVITPAVEGIGTIDPISEFGPELGEEFKRIISDISNLNDDDFDDTDEVVQDFKNQGGVNKVIKIVLNKPLDEAKKEIETIANSLEEKRKYAFKKALRKAYYAANKIANKQSTDFRTTAMLINTAATYADNEQDTQNLLKSFDSILSSNENHYAGAVYRLKTLYANTMPKNNIRVAYTNLGTQEGEPYQLCPKAAYQLGYQIPMPVSTCRDNCIDSRVMRDGRISCAYRDWVTVVADNQKALNNRLDVHRVNDDDVSYINIEAGERNAPISKKVQQTLKTTETRLNEKTRDKVKIPNISTESRLEKLSPVNFGHQGDKYDIEGNGTFARKASILEDKIDFKSKGTLGKQVEKGNCSKCEEKNIEQLLSESGKHVDTNDVNTMIDRILEKNRKDIKNYKPNYAKYSSKCECPNHKDHGTNDVQYRAKFKKNLCTGCYKQWNK